MAKEITTTSETATEPKRKAKAPKRAKAAKATKQAGKATKSPPRSTKPKERSKKERILELLRRKEGATIADIAKATEWQNHSIRGFLSGRVTKRMGLSLESSKDEGGERTYRITE